MTFELAGFLRCLACGLPTGSSADSALRIQWSLQQPEQAHRCSSPEARTTQPWVMVAQPLSGTSESKLSGFGFAATRAVFFGCGAGTLETLAAVDSLHGFPRLRHRKGN